MKIGIIGGGAMGGGLARGLINGNHIQAENITIANPHTEKLEDLAVAGVNVTENNDAAVKGVDLIVFAVKPWILPDVVKKVAADIDASGQEVCAIVAGVSSSDLRSWFGENLPERFSISMPNTAMSVSESMTFLVNINGDCPLAKKVFDKLGKTDIVAESKLDAGMALASCGMAFAMRYVRAACEGGVELGFRASEAQRIVAQTLKGAVKLLEQSESHPEVEIDKVTTPGGITIRGLNAMERAGFTNAVIEGLLTAAGR